MSQNMSNHKRRWLKNFLSSRARKALLLAPAFFSPLIVSDTGRSFGQEPATAVATSPSTDATFVYGWLDRAIRESKEGRTDSAAAAFAEAWRGSKMLGSPDSNESKAVQARLAQADVALRENGVKKQQVLDAIPKLGEIRRAPSVVQAAAAAMPALPSVSGMPQDQSSRVRPATPQVTAATGSPFNEAVATLPVRSADYVPQQDGTQAIQASNLQVSPAEPMLSVPSPTGESGVDLYRRGVELLGAGDRQAAYDTFRRAWEYQGELDIATRNSLKDKLSSMQMGTLSQPSSPAVRQVSQEELAMRQRMMSEVTGELAAAEANREAEPQVVADRLQTLRTRVSQANLDGNTRKQLLTIVDRQITAHQIYINQNKASIEQNMRNRQITEQIALDQEERYKLDQQIASLVETYNDLMDKSDFMEAESIAKQVGTLDPNSTIASLLISNARNRRRIGEYEAIRQMKEDKFVDNMLTVDEAAIPMDDRQPLLFDAKRWAEVSRRSEGQIRESQQGMSPAEREIWDSLRQPVLVDFQQQPLASVAKTLSDMTGVMMHIDEAGLALEGFSSDMPVTLSLPSQVSLRSALNLLLNTRNLDFQVQNEVLMITSARNTAQANVQRTYSVKDLVIPIPNFVTDYNSGMAGALRQAYESLGRGLVAQTNGGPQIGAGGNVQMASATMPANSPALGQMGGMNGLAGGNLPPAIGGGFGLGGGNGPTMGSMGGSAPMSMGSPGAIGGGAAMADFDTLMNLIQQTIDPDSWLLNGGTSTILPYPANLSLVVSAPQTTHEKITDLLESLRRLQDLQVTIEVKFITLNDNFFERIGVDFDLRIDDNVRNLPLDDQGPSTTVGLNANFDPTSGVIPFTADFDIGLTQESFTSAVPAFGGFDAASGASLGFAILSDLEMFFFMNAAQGDQRTSVLQAPRVTMFDGQFASINDTIQRPFVTGLVPIVGDFAVAQQPVIVVLNEGTVLNVQATVTADKRFVRLTLNPTFSAIDRVDTFTFEGTRTT
ncbi:MAG: hypothetical protein AB8B50_19815, partial [Pirellulaceae bacterium]